MGNPSRPELHPRVAEWGISFRGVQRTLVMPPTVGLLKSEFDFELKEYFRLACLARGTRADPALAKIAHRSLFRARVVLERSITNAIETAQCSRIDRLDALFKCSFFGCSKKQGASLRMPLSTCTPTVLCAGGCYAHDVLDASPAAMVRGAVNGWIARAYETGNSTIRDEIMTRLIRHTKKATRHAMNELNHLSDGFSRRAFIRFSHVGEIVFFPDFANALAKQAHEISHGKVDCVVYTRHKRVKKLDPELWIINFTLDPVSMNRRSWAPDHARIVFSAFGGVVSSIVDVNFLEHHRHSHSRKTSGNGRICPATLPDTSNRTCDDCRCNRCFVSPRDSSTTNN